MIKKRGIRITKFPEQKSLKELTDIPLETIRSIYDLPPILRKKIIQLVILGSI